MMHDTAEHDNVQPAHVDPELSMRLHGLLGAGAHPVHSSGRANVLYLQHLVFIRPHQLK